MKTAEYIEREKAYEAVLFATCGSGYQYEATCAIDLMPAADVAPVVHGHWTTECYNVPICSICGTYVSKDVYNSEDSTPNFCPHCGAKMDEEEHDNV